jgi:hypothetical protein
MESLGGLPRCTLFCVVGHLIADERCDLTDVEVCQQHRDDDLCRSETADTAAVGGFQVLGTLGLHLGVQRLGAVSGMGVEGVPFLGAVVEGLLLSADFRGVEGDGLLGTDFVGEVRHVLLVDGRQYLFFFQQLAERAGDAGAGTDGRAAQYDASFRVGFFLLVQLERCALSDLSALGQGAYGRLAVT